MRISDWSSDVCSSDLIAIGRTQTARKSKRARAIHAKVANRRKDYLHKASAKIASQYGTVIVGDVESSKLARTRLAKSVLDAGWSGFKRMLSYKALMHGGRYLEVSERMSTQTCSECGTLRSEEHTSELQSLMRFSYAVFCLKKKTSANTVI